MGIKYDMITRYYKGQEVHMADFDFFAKVCYVSDCKIEDLQEYQKPPNQE